MIVSWSRDFSSDGFTINTVTFTFQDHAKWRITPSGGSRQRLKVFDADVVALE